MKIASPRSISLALLAIFLACAEPLRAQMPGKKLEMRKAGELIRKQEPPQITARLMEKASPDNTRVLISLSKQRAYLIVEEEIAIDTPISSGKAAGMTPSGKFTVLEKDPSHRSGMYGDFVDSNGRIVRAGVSLKIDSAPSGTQYVGVPMQYFMRLTNEGVGMHMNIGSLPGYPASHGCVRLPADIAPLVYGKVKVGTPVEVTP